MNDAEIAAMAAQMKKQNPAELIQKALNASMELQELLEDIQKDTGEIKSAVRFVYKDTQASAKVDIAVVQSLIAVHTELAEVKALVVQTAECLEKHKDAHAPAPAV